VLNDKLHAKLKLCVFGVAVGFLSHVMVSKGGGDTRDSLGEKYHITWVHIGGYILRKK